MDGSFAAFLGISAVVIMTPGQDTALTIRNTLLGGRPTGVATALGVAVGQAGWTLAASLGLTALLVASEFAFAAIRLIGAGYLVYLGARSLWIAIRPGHAAERDADDRASDGVRRRHWNSGRGGAKQRNCSRSLGAETADRPQLGNLRTHRVHDAPTA